MRPDTAAAISLAVAVGLGAMAMLRLIDLNEKEPLWALLLLAWFGVVAASLAALLTSQKAGQESALGIVVTAELAKAAAVAGGLWLLTVGSRAAGRASEVNGLVDTLIYGAAAGAGFAIGDGLLRDTFGTAAEIQTPLVTDTLDRAWMSLQSVLLEGLTAAIFAASLGLAQRMSPGVRRVLTPLGGLAAAIAVHALTLATVHDGAPVGAEFSAEAALATGVMLSGVAAAVVYALRVERRTIIEQLEREADERVVTRDEIERFARPTVRRKGYAKNFLGGDLDGWRLQRWLQNRQAQLALSERERQRSDGANRERLEAITAGLRDSIRRRRERSSSDPAASREPSTRRARRRIWLPVALSAAFVVLGGGAVVVAASGPEAPTTTATRISVSERERYELQRRERGTQVLKHRLQQVVGSFRLVQARRRAHHGGLRPAEAYELDYAADRGAEVRYVVAAMGSGADADEKRRELAVAADDQRRVWRNGSTVSAAWGSADAVDEFCAALPVELRPDRLDEYRAAAAGILPESWEPEPIDDGFSLIAPSRAYFVGSRLSFTGSARSLAEVLGSEGLPGFRRHRLRRVELGPRQVAWRQESEWIAGEGTVVKQVQLFFVECGSGYVVTAGAAAGEFRRLARTFDRALLALADVR